MQIVSQIFDFVTRLPGWRNGSASVSLSLTPPFAAHKGGVAKNFSSELLTENLGLLIWRLWVRAPRRVYYFLLDH